jgi:hypothetical protein
MDKKSIMEPPTVAGSADVSKLPDLYGCGPVRLVGAHDSLYERPLMFDNVVDRAAIDLRQSFEGFARSVILNIAGSGKFSSDRTVGEYTTGIWKVTPCPVR